MGWVNYSMDKPLNNHYIKLDRHVKVTCCYFCTPLYFYLTLGHLGGHRCENGVCLCSMHLW
uniref:Uncharacterized protein n=1 Tax=Siphoviridae sp. ct87j35 TaxID=2825356 RepID=A0A8S5V4U2_9CAUD|nr:MAG TPA: hypothetical protein [Siphoviridae sp. ct87j35]